MAIYRLNLKKGTTVTATSDVRGTKSKAKYEYNTRSGNYAERGDLVYTEDFNFKELDYDPKKFWLMSEDRTIINYDYTSYKECLALIKITKSPYHSRQSIWIFICLALIKITKSPYPLDRTQS